jgi:hypothetical protein
MANTVNKTDEELLALVKYGPGVIGQDVYDAVQECVVRTKANAQGQNILGPGILGYPKLAPSETPATREELEAQPYATLRGLASQHGVEVVGNPKKPELVDALLVAAVVVTETDAE